MYTKNGSERIDVPFYLIIGLICFKAHYILLNTINVFKVLRVLVVAFLFFCQIFYFPILCNCSHQSQLKEVTDGELNQSLQENGLLVRASAGLTVDIFLFDNHAMESNDIKVSDLFYLWYNILVVFSNSSSQLNGNTPPR